MQPELKNLVNSR